MTPEEIKNMVMEWVEEQVDKTARTVAIDIDRNLILETPVDTGRARAGWFPMVTNSPPTYVPPEEQYKGKKNVPPPPIPGLRKIKLGEKIYVSNNVPYIIYLDQGHSKQAPAGYVDRTVSRVIREYV